MSSDQKLIEEGSSHKDSDSLFADSRKQSDFLGNQDPEHNIHAIDTINSGSNHINQVKPQEDQNVGAMSSSALYNDKNLELYPNSDALDTQKKQISSQPLEYKNKDVLERYNQDLGNVGGADNQNIHINTLTSPNKLNNGQSDNPNKLNNGQSDNPNKLNNGQSDNPNNHLNDGGNVAGSENSDAQNDRVPNTDNQCSTVNINKESTSNANNLESNINLMTSNNNINSNNKSNTYNTQQNPQSSINLASSSFEPPNIMGTNRFGSFPQDPVYTSSTLGARQPPINNLQQMISQNPQHQIPPFLQSILNNNANIQQNITGNINYPQGNNYYPSLMNKPSFPYVSSQANQPNVSNQPSYQSTAHNTPVNYSANYLAPSPYNTRPQRNKYINSSSKKALPHPREKINRHPFCKVNKCHQCKKKSKVAQGCFEEYACTSCNKMYCFDCLTEIQRENIIDIISKTNRWQCPQKRKICTCDSCAQNIRSYNDYQQAIQQDQRDRAFGSIQPSANVSRSILKQKLKTLMDFNGQLILKMKQNINKLNSSEVVFQNKLIHENLTVLDNLCKILWKTNAITIEE